ncbi:carboxypeptidase-like regulatory domain-containing protein [Pseudoduganella sp. SL102]|uniref:carboxypeptidase-like regulatory domain-containing protein n=1 Tax=Pseudoduganella sp. SL102 TaxID=2995154 RepID=UPI00248AF45D|nr:carboxypeptidase-like regulatory domain-containing protein [Pseudoduganella sp. SL102]WBR99912.1 carboxypeptidase-like regulatory domain-containing protein [Pseudoduganella sp. SL102]
MSTRKLAKGAPAAVAAVTVVAIVEGRGTIEVKVTDQVTGRPLVGATIRLFRARDVDGPTFRSWTRDECADWRPQDHDQLLDVPTGPQGIVTFEGLEPGLYFALYDHVTPADGPDVYRFEGGEVDADTVLKMDIRLPIGPAVTFEFEQSATCARTRDPVVGSRAIAVVRFQGSDGSSAVTDRVGLEADGPWQPEDGNLYSAGQMIRKPGRHDFIGRLVFARRAGQVIGTPSLVPSGITGGAKLAVSGAFVAEERPAQPISGNIGVALTRTETEATPDLALWTLIRNSTEALSFNNYMDFLDQLFCVPPADPANAPFERTRFGKKSSVFQSLKHRRALPFTDSESYRVLKAATEAFVMVNCGVLREPFAFDPVNDNAYLDRRDIPASGDLRDTLVQDYLESVGGTEMLPYLAVIRRKLPDVPVIPSGSGHCDEAELCFGIIQDRLSNPCLIELIWSYWQEEGMLVQTMNVITQRFQNLRSPLVSDPLANTEIDMLRPLNNLLWGYTQDEQHRLTVVRRNYEYDHHYGIRLDGKAVRNMRPADSRSKFLEAFHHLLRLLTSFYRQDDDTTVKADAFPILNALKEVHLILSQGAHNQYGDLPSTARIEMLMQQWLLARPEFREFLPTRVMVAYPEPWMDRVDAMKKLQLWSDTSVMHFRNLAIFGEQLLLSIRFGHWSDVYEATQAFNWARFWRPQAQGYIHAYRAATGVDLSIDAANPAEEATLPSVLLRQRLARQQQRSAM